MHTLRVTHSTDKAVATVALLIGLAFGGWAASKIISEVDLLEPEKLLAQLLLASLLLFWVAAPYLVVATTALFASTGRTARGLLLLLTLALTAIGIWTFASEDDAERVVAVVFVPLSQLMTAVLVFVLVTAVEWFLRHRARR